MTTSRVFRIEVYPRKHNTDSSQNRWVRAAHQLNFATLTGCLSARLFFVRGTLTQADVQRLSQELLADPVTEQFSINQAGLSADHTLDVVLHPGVTDPVADNLIRAAALLNLEIDAAATGSRYYLTGDLSPDDLEQLATRVFASIVIQDYAIDDDIAAPFVTPAVADGHVEIIPLLQADTVSLLAISKERRLALDAQEMQAIQTYYRQQERDPSDIELETLAQTWSEHCVHKTFRATIDFTDADGTQERIHGLLKTYIRAATEQIDKPELYSVFVDNAGIVRFDDRYDLAFKAETHNHPSALEPFGGANTGVGGVIRDILGVSARPIATTDILCFGPEDLPDSDLLDGVLHPRRIQDGVIHGIEDYGNKMGIPTVNGAILYDRGYTQNPLVFCGCLGILPHGSHPTQPQDGDLIVVLGGRTGRDGLRGATFSSMEMDTETGDIASVSVQIGHPINEKQVQEVVLRARDEKLYNAITDCGAGGLSSAVGEMGESLGATVELTTVPLKYPGLQPWEIWLSEAQERMVMAVPQANLDRLQTIADGQDVLCVVIGTYQATGKLTIQYDGRTVGDLHMDFLHNGIPTRHLQATWQPPASSDSGDTTVTDDASLDESLLHLLAHPDIRSKEDTVRRYDHEVQGGTAVKPLVGHQAQGHGDSSVLVPLDTISASGEMTGTAIKGVALSAGICPQYGDDPCAMAWAAVDEAFRNLVATGADPDQVYLLDNFCWGNPNLPDRLGSLVLAAKGCHDAALAYNAPFISGKDSLNNEYADADGTRHAIPGTLLISAMGIVPDVTQTVTMDLKQPGDSLYLIGTTRPEMGGSHYHLLHGLSGGTVPQPDDSPLTTLRRLHQAIRAGLITACHDVSEGGIAVALAEMCIAGNLGADIDLSVVADDAVIAWFAESTGRFLISVAPEQADALESLFADVPLTRLGSVIDTPEVRLHNDLSISLSDLRTAWRGHLAETLPDTPAKDEIPLTSVSRVDPARSRQSTRTGPPRVLILHASGTNRDRDAALACSLAGAEPEIVHINQLIHEARHLLDYHMLVVPGGFSYGDDLGAGQLWAQDLRYRLRDDLEQFVQDGRPVMGICNGFQVLVKAGILPYADFASGHDRRVTLTYNENQRFECRPVYLKPQTGSVSLFTAGLDDLILCPVAHGEGRVRTRDETVLTDLFERGLVPLTCVTADGDPAGYPANPNGSDAGIAALCNPAGNVLGLMPHPENHIFPWQHPYYHRGERGMSGLVLFENAVKQA